MQLSPTDLPEPVVPATSKCGIGARSAMTGSPLMFFPRISGKAMFWSSNVWLPISSLRETVGKLDADHAAAGNGGDPRRQCGHVAGDVVGKLDDSACLDPAGWLQLVHGDDWAGTDLDDIPADVEVLQHALQQPGIALQPCGIDLALTFFGR